MIENLVRESEVEKINSSRAFMAKKEKERKEIVEERESEKERKRM